jgi:prepilin-type N-terminal cleavage/methylation domain-containing protein
MRTRTHNRAFTLIEILIVVVILGILAAIVIPQFTDASQEAMEASVRSQLQTIRGQIELYNVQNPQAPYDAATALGTFWDPLVAGSYLQQAPRNPLQGGVTVVGAAPAVGTGWVWAADANGNMQLTAVDENGAAFVE